MPITPMPASALDAKPYGIGELITQRKLFAVPEHQRNYSWGVENVEQFLNDILHAVVGQASDYFVGLVVLQGPDENVWRILDGQQRLATTTMIYSAVRHWLNLHGFPDDSKQIEDEFIGVRQLGGRYQSRLTLNVENRAFFYTCVVDSPTNQELAESIDGLSKGTSNRKLLEAALFCRTRIDEIAQNFGSTDEERAQALFSFAFYLEKRVKVVCVDVSSEADAYVLFEALNDRGADLSALDLVKNYVFSKLETVSSKQLEEKWRTLSESLDGQDADDFLKVFWTARFGKVQKVHLFRKLSAKYNGQAEVLDLLDSLVRTAQTLEAIDDYEHPLWSDLGPAARDLIGQLHLIGSRQVRPVIVSALERLDRDVIEQFLWTLVVLLVRYQLIGRERTGILEQILGNLAASLWHCETTTIGEVNALVESILPDDETFERAFAGHEERKPSRINYLLACLETAKRSGACPVQVLPLIASTIVVPIMLHEDEGSASGPPVGVRSIGNFFLAESDLAPDLKGLKDSADAIKVLRKSDFATTRMNLTVNRWDASELKTRLRFLARLAVATWRI